MTISKCKIYLSKHYSLLLKVIVYGYIAFIIVGFLPLYGRFTTENWFDWKIFTTFYGDIEAYEKMAYGLYNEVSAPYKFRVLIPFLWSIFLPFISLKSSVLIWNLLFLTSSSLLTDRYLDSFNFSKYYKLIGVLFINISFPIIQIAFTPNLDIAFLFFALLFMLGIVEKNPYLIGLASILGIITKETFLFLFPIYFIYNYQEIKEFIKKIWKQKRIIDYRMIFSLLFMSCALIEFLAIRGFVFNINYDFDLGKLEFPVYYERWLYFDGIIETLKYILLTLTILWIGPLGYVIHKWKLDKWFYLSIYGLFTIIAITFLSSHIARVSFFLIIIYLPVFLKFIKDFEK